MPRRTARDRDAASCSRSRSCSRTRPRGSDALAPMCTPAHTHANLGTRPGLWSYSLAPFLAAVFRMPAPPWPRRGRVGHARGRQGEGHRFLGRHGHTLSPTEPRTHTREPTANTVLAATHGVGPGLRRVPRCDALSRPSPNLAVTPTLAVVFTLRVRAASRTPSHTCSHVPALGRVANTAAALASPRPHRRRPHRDGHQLPVLRPSSPATKGVPCGRPILASRPGAVGLAVDEVIPRRHLPRRHLVEHLGSLLKARVGRCTGGHMPA
jgi:hypothetical protein